jgi:hypothetical protein
MITRGCEASISLKGTLCEHEIKKKLTKEIEKKTKE